MSPAFYSEIMHGRHSLCNVLTRVTLLSLNFTNFYENNILMLPILELDTNYGFHELFVNFICINRIPVYF
jgi:hypothetical protein